jgi:hypothetical protein
MQIKSKITPSHSRVIVFLAVMVLVLSALSIAFAQEEDDVSSSDPVQRALVVATDAVEESTGSSLTVVNWKFYQDNWSTEASWRQYDSFGIDNCASGILLFNKRSDVLFGWTFTLTDISGKRYAARVSFDLKDSVVCDEVAPEPVAEPAVITNEAGEVINIDLPAAAAGTANVEGFQLGGHVDGLTPQVADLVRSAGMTWVKKQIPMEAGIGKGIEFINTAQGNGFKILLGVVGDKNALATDFGGYSAQFASFVGQLAAAGADAIEIWNEPNIDREWPQGQINGANYVSLLAPAYNAIKAANPNTIVISGAPAPTGFAGAAGCIPELCNDDVFMQQMATAGAASYVDCVGLHYNEGIVSPGTFSGDPRGEYPTYYFSSMLNRGYSLFGGKKICFTEFGYLSAEGMGAPIPPAFGWAGNTTLGQQATWLAEAAAAAAQSGNVALMIVWNVNFSRWDSDPMGGYAMLRPDGSCPACQTLGSVMSG